MKYYRYGEDEDHPLGGGTTYVETLGGWTLRQITDHGGEYFASNINYQHWGLRLADQRIDFDALDEVAPIPQQEFENVWNAHLRQHSDRWEAVKQAYPLGAPVVGSILVFYPQGVVVDLGNNALGVADSTACHASAPPAWIPATRHKITAVVDGYDETNQWVVLAAPHVHAERVGHLLIWARAATAHGEARPQANALALTKCTSPRLRATAAEARLLTLWL